MNLFPHNWPQVFVVETPLLELFARGTFLYLGILALMRFLPRRTGGELTLADLVFILLIANAAANAFGNYTSVTDGMILVAILMGWDYLLNFLSYHVPFIEYLTSSPPLQVVRNGRLLQRNMRRELLTKEELMTNFHQQGVEDLDEVKSAYIEGNGKITIICRNRTKRNK